MRYILLIAIGFVWLATNNASATEQALTAPSGWVFGSNAYAAAESSVAAVAYKYNSNDPSLGCDKSLVIQARTGGPTSATEFGGKVFYVAYSPDGHLLLVGQANHSDRSPIFRTSLLDAEGHILWSKEGANKILRFSTDGSAIVSWEYGAFGGPGTFEIYQLSGELKHRLTFGDFLQGVVAVGDGTDVILLTERSVMRYSVVQKVMISVWRINLPEDSASIVRATLLDSERITAELEDGGRLIITTSGQIAVSLKPTPSNPSPQLTTGAEQIVEATDETVSLLDPGAATVTEYNVVATPILPEAEEVSAPAGFTLLQRPCGGRLFYFSPQEIRVR